MAVASAGTYASLHLAPDRQPCQQPATQFFTGRMPFLPPNQQRQSTEGMEAISREFRAVLPWELLYADDLAVIAETEEELIKRLNE